MLELFNKVAEENGLFEQPFIALAKDEEGDKKSDIDPIALLYGKQKDVKTMDELLEEAHPDVAVKSPAYDLMNGVVENLHQRQRVMVDIALKTPRVLQTNYRYIKASQDLLEETTKLGFLLENKKSKLMSYSDNCTDELIKEAGAFLAIIPAVKFILPYVALFAAGVGATALASNAIPGSLGILNDLNNAKKEVLDVIKEHPKHSSSLSTFTSLLDNTHSAISSLEDLDIEFSNQRASLAALPKDERINAVISLYNQMASSKKDEKILEFIKKCNDMLSAVVEATPQIITIIQKISSLEEKSSTFMSFLHSAKEFFVPGDIKEAINQLNVLLDSANLYLGLLKDKEQNLLALKNEISKYHKDNVKQEILETIPFEAKKTQ
jgi:hypothetical protein